MFVNKKLKPKIIYDKSKTKANLYVTVGPENKPGVMLSGHTDVVPVDGQKWTKNPFKMTVKDGKIYGRGAADMKGFVACAISIALKATEQKLSTPLHVALSYDEEIGCIGVRSMINTLKKSPVRPAMCIVGEPTNMKVATGHKGKVALNVICTGKEKHSAFAPTTVNAIHIACDVIGEIRKYQTKLQKQKNKNHEYDIPYTTLHVGNINGGNVLNIVPNKCQFGFEIRNVKEDDPDKIISDIKKIVRPIINNAKKITKNADVKFEVVNEYPGLNTQKNQKVVEFVMSLTGENSTTKVAFGTEGGLFDRELGTPTVVCGPGSMEQGHKPDEYIKINQIKKCDAMLEKLLNYLVSGIK